jgi:phenylacetate-CoA ligase
MPFDLIERPLNANAYDDRPFTLLDQGAQNFLAIIASINLIENGDRTARENWQNRQLTNLLTHVHARSAFWRERMPSRMINYGIMKYLPVQRREDVMSQVTLEGSLLANNRDAPVSSYASTGSTGTPVKIYYSRECGYYNSIRGLAQYFIRNLSLDENRVTIGTRSLWPASQGMRPSQSTAKLENALLDVRKSDSWAGPLGKVFRTGSAKDIVYRHDDNALINELLKERVGYLVCPSRYIDILMSSGGVDLIQKLGVRLWVHLSDYRDPENVNKLIEIGVPSLSSYSAAETGPIALECTKHQGYFHVAHTNAVVECDHQLTVSWNGALLGRLLITHLHSWPRKTFSAATQRQATAVPSLDPTVARSSRFQGMPHQAARQRKNYYRDRRPRKSND